MSKSVTVLAGVATTLVACAAARAEPAREAAPAGRGAEPLLVADVLPDPMTFFEQLAERYRRISWYEDTVDVVQITARQGYEPRRVERRINCAIRDGRLTVTTSARQVLWSLGLFVPLEEGPAIEEARRQYDLWLAPHLMMKYAEEPLQEFRVGVEDGFTATTVEPVTIDDRAMVHLKLESAEESTVEPEATFDLFVDPKSMLIERIEGQEKLPDGASYRTTVQIRPQHGAVADAEAGDGTGNEARAPSAKGGSGGEAVPAQPAAGPPLTGSRAPPQPQESGREAPPPGASGDTSGEQRPPGSAGDEKPGGGPAPPPAKPPAGALGMC